MYAYFFCSGFMLFSKKKLTFGQFMLFFLLVFPLLVVVYLDVCFLSANNLFSLTAQLLESTSKNRKHSLLSRLYARNIITNNRNMFPSILYESFLGK